MTQKDKKDRKHEPVPTTRNEELDQRDTDEAVDEVLDPAMPPVGAGAMLDVDPRLNRKSETEVELERATKNDEEPDERRPRRRGRSCLRV